MIKTWEKGREERKEITEAETPQYLQPTTHRGGRSKVREQVGEEVGL